MILSFYFPSIQHFPGSFEWTFEDCIYNKLTTDKNTYIFTHFHNRWRVPGSERGVHYKGVSTKVLHVSIEMFIFSCYKPQLCAFYLGRGSLLCSGPDCLSFQRCRKVTGLPSSQTSALPAPTSPRWNLRCTLHVARYKLYIDLRWI